MEMVSVKSRTPLRKRNPYPIYFVLISLVCIVVGVIELVTGHWGSTIVFAILFVVGLGLARMTCGKTR